MIKSRSPHYVVTPFVSPLTSATCTSYVLNVYVWDGLKASVPATPTYSLTKENPTSSTGTDSVNIAKLVNDFIDFTPQSNVTTDNIDGNNQVWVQHEAVYTTANPTDDNVKQNVTIDLLVQGYGGGLDGLNPSTPTNKVLLTGSEFNVQRTGFFIIPILADESTPDSATVKSFPSLQINAALTIDATTTSSELVQYIVVKTLLATTDTYMEIVYNGVTITLYITDECRYTPVEIVFNNKEGAQQILTFFKAKTDTLSTTDETFESDRGQPSESNHQFVRFNVNGKKSFKINSGFVDEDMNDTFEELFLSEDIWQYDGTNFIPLNIKSTSLQFKTRQNDRLINYEVEFDFAFNEINSI